MVGGRGEGFIIFSWSSGQLTSRTDEPKIYGCHYKKVVIHPEKTLCIYYDYWWQNVTDGPMVTEWAVASRQRFCNALIVEHKCSTSLPINEVYHYKREDNRNPRYAQLHTNTLGNLSQLVFPLESFPLTDLSVGGGLADTTTACYSSPLFIFARFSSTEMIPFTKSSIRYDEELNYWFFASSRTISHSKFSYFEIFVCLQ